MSKRRQAADAELDEGMELEFTKEIHALRGNMQEKALEIVRNAMPSKVLSLTAVLDSKEMNMELSAIRQPVVLTEAVTGHATDADAAEGSRKKRKLDEDGHSANDESTSKHGVKSREIIPSNKNILPLLAIIKSHSLEFIENCSVVKIWIQLNIPRIEDGNNFGVSIQEETLNELGRAEDAAFAALDSMSKYFVSRAKLVAKCIKYPGVEDFKQSVMELDEKEYVDLKITCKELRNNYAILHDMIVKNFEKIRKPRSDHSVSLY